MVVIPSSCGQEEPDLETCSHRTQKNSQKQRLQSGLPDAPQMPEVQNSFAGLKTDNLELRPLQARDAAQLFLFRGSDTEAVWRDHLMGVSLGGSGFPLHLRE